MVAAANAVHAMDGGVAVTHGDRIVASLSLPIYGLISDEPVAGMARDFAAVEQALRDLGMCHHRPFLLLSVMGLSVSPNFKFSDKGIVDTERRRLLPPWRMGDDD